MIAALELLLAVVWAVFFGLALGYPPVIVFGGVVCMGLARGAWALLELEWEGA